MPGKRTERLHLPRQLRVSEQLAEEVKQMAATESRTIQQQLLVLIAEGIRQHEREPGK